MKSLRCFTLTFVYDIRTAMSVIRMIALIKMLIVSEIRTLVLKNEVSRPSNRLLGDKALVKTIV